AGKIRVAETCFAVRSPHPLFLPMGSAAGCPTRSEIETQIRTCPPIRRSRRRSQLAVLTDEAAKNDYPIDGFYRGVGSGRRCVRNEGSSWSARTDRTNGTRTVRESDHRSRSPSAQRDPRERAVRSESRLWWYHSVATAESRDGQLLSNSGGRQNARSAEDR